MGDKDRAITLEEGEPDTRNGKLVYQDGTACSASYAFHDIYLLENGTYTVYTKCGCNDGKKDIKPYDCDNICQVIDFLLEFCFHDPNSVGDVFLYIINNHQLKVDDVAIHHSNGLYPIFDKCHGNRNLIEAIMDEI